ncbi:MAG: dTMP kinase [Gammaproteobacteria bacterium RIFCSPHIGHO2_12_FULL_41_20]|nr:MAG: dTMP kinase [Gammaproteobacteria bacterium RIFCSPHIGHO2_12_FULL_41_20]
MFISVEGIEGAGKSTILHYIQTYLSANHDVVVTREPGGTPLAEQMRHILLHIDVHEIMTAEAELLLMFAGRAQHIERVIKPALLAGKWVVSDRFVDATYAYQGGGRGVNERWIDMLEQWIVKGVKPCLTVLLDVPPELGLARAQRRSPQDRIEREKVDFFARVRESYLHRAQAEPQRIRVLDATQPLDTVQAQVRALLQQLTAKAHAK